MSTTSENGKFAESDQRIINRDSGNEAPYRHEAEKIVRLLRKWGRAALSTVIGAAGITAFVEKDAIVAAVSQSPEGEDADAGELKKEKFQYFQDRFSSLSRTSKEVENLLIQYQDAVQHSDVSTRDEIVVSLKTAVNYLGLELTAAVSGVRFPEDPLMTKMLNAATESLGTLQTIEQIEIESPVLQEHLAYYLEFIGEKIDVREKVVSQKIPEKSADEAWAEFQKFIVENPIQKSSDTNLHPSFFEQPTKSIPYRGKTGQRLEE